MTNKAKLALIAAIAVTRLAATPAFAQSFEADGTGNVLQMTYQSTAPDAAVRHSGARAARRNGLDAYAMDPQHARRTMLAPHATEPRPQSDFDSDSPAATGGGSVGYNELLKVEP